MEKIEVIFAGNKKVNVKFRGFEIKTDQPVEAGGDGTAPTPYDLFMASLAACAGIFAISFFQTRRLNTDGFKMWLEVEWDGVKHRLSKVVIKMKLSSNFPEKYKKALMESVSLCSVKRTIIDPPEFDIVVE
ncbi:MAG: OsmC family protein [Elusimicrobiales bacterium]